MRDILLALLVLGGGAYAMRHVWFGAVLWTWVSVMNPHLMAYGFMRSAPIALIVFGFTVIGLVFSREKRNPYVDKSVWWLTFFVVWICITHPFSLHVEESKDMLVKVIKVDLMIVISIAVLVEKKHIQWFIAVMAFSLGFYGVKGGIFTIVGGGSERVWGPGGFIGGNNEIALALITIIPFMYYLYTIATARRWVRWMLLGSMLLTAVAAIGTQSRGALLGISAMGAFLWYRGEKKMITAVVLGVFALGLASFMPESWWERMGTIKTYESDGSAMGRINAWIMCWNLALARPLGSGFWIYGYDTFALYAPSPEDIAAAHSIYFQVLGEHGFVGFAIWLMIWFYAWRGAAFLRKEGRLSPDTQWCVVLGSMCQVSMIGFAVGGAFLSLAYFDLPYNIMVVVVCAKKWLQNQCDRCTNADAACTGVARLIAMASPCGRRQPTAGVS